MNYCWIWLVIFLCGCFPPYKKSASVLEEDEMERELEEQGYVPSTTSTVSPETSAKLERENNIRQKYEQYKKLIEQSDDTIQNQYSTHRDMDFAWENLELAKTMLQEFEKYSDDDRENYLMGMDIDEQKQQVSQRLQNLRLKKISIEKEELEAKRERAAEIQRSREEAAVLAETQQEEYLEECGPTPKGVKAKILKRMRKIAHDPKSVRLVECSRPAMTEQYCWEVNCSYRGKNAYGALVLNSGLFYLHKDGMEGPIDN